MILMTLVAILAVIPGVPMVALAPLALVVLGLISGFMSPEDDLLTRLRHHDFSILVGCFKLASHIASIRS